ncbi:hypothetical protein, partial [Terribacillus saccharophilus]|uniref:hypothetical protein n=1 Tax=Terribacillus saccharophilus TaxID=361277 RepID=UPI002DCE0F86|nr:hypothetical protein [Terribacillus saccharophilus]
IDIIARKPLALKDFMEKTKMDQYALRLQVVKKAIMEPPEEAEEIMIDNPESISIASKKVFENKGSMSPYLSRMKDIMILRSKMEENNDVKKHLQLEYKNRVISWDKFYFGPEYKDFLTLSKYFRSKSKPDHPICIEGIVKEHSTETDRRGEKYYSFLFEKPYVTEVNIDGFRHIPSVRVNIYEKYKKLLHFVKENYQKHNKQIITYGNPYVNVNTYAPHNAKYHNITIWVNRTAQVHLFNETMEKLFEET